MTKKVGAKLLRCAYCGEPVSYLPVEGYEECVVELVIDNDEDEVVYSELVVLCYRCRLFGYRGRMFMLYKDLFERKKEEG